VPRLNRGINPVVQMYDIRTTEAESLVTRQTRETTIIVAAKLRGKIYLQFSQSLKRD